MNLGYGHGKKVDSNGKFSRKNLKIMLGNGGVGGVSEREGRVRKDNRIPV